MPQNCRSNACMLRFTSPEGMYVREVEAWWAIEGRPAFALHARYDRVALFSPKKRHATLRGEGPRPKYGPPGGTDFTTATCVPSALIRRQPSLLIRQSSVLTHHSSVTSHQSSLISHQSSVISHQLSLITHHSSLITHHSPLITQHPTPSTHHQHSALSIQHPTPSTHHSSLNAQHTQSRRLVWREHAEKFTY